MKDDKVENEIKDRFKALMERTETDAELKKEVFSTISALENIASVIDLFTVKFVSSETKFISDILPENNSDEEKV